MPKKSRGRGGKKPIAPSPAVPETQRESRADAAAREFWNFDDKTPPPRAGQKEHLERLVELGRPYQFKPGQSGNPAGRPKGVKYVSEAVREFLERALAPGSEYSLADALAKALIDQALAGDVSALREVMDRAEGKVAVAVTGADGGPLLGRPEPSEVAAALAALAEIRNAKK